MNEVRVPRALAVAAWLIVTATAGGAQMTTRDSASVLVFPKVIVDVSWDTTIQLTNTANRPARAICYYVNGSLTNPSLPPGPLNPRLWTQADFELSLVPQQPTHWVVSRGRPSDESDNRCDDPSGECDGTGFDPGRVPPVDAGFSGELLCYEVDASGAPWSGNALIGHATLTHLGSGEVAKYPAIGSLGLQTNDANGTLCLGGEPGGNCPDGAEYRGCSQEWILSHPTDYDDLPVDGEASRTNLAIAPCGHDFLTQVPKRLTLQFEVTTEFEERFSASASVDCWSDLALAEVGTIFNRATTGADWVQTRVRASASSLGGFVVIQQTSHETARPALRTLVATAPPQGDLGAHTDLIQVPQGSVQ